MIAHIAIAFFIVIGIILFLLLGCTIDVKPIAKPKPKVVYVHKKTHHKAKPHATPTHLLQPDDGPTKLIPISPEPTP